jgi:hypothetical protein
VLLESYEQGWQRRAVIVALLHEIAGLSQRKTGKLLDLSQPLDPRTVSPMPIGPEKAAGSKNPLLVVVRQRLSDALGQGLLDFRKLILVLVAFLFFLGILLHSFRILQRVVVVVEPHDAIERMGQDPVKRRSQSLRFLLQRIDRRSDLEIAGAAALDRHGQLPILKSRIEALPLGDITHLQVILDVALKQVPAPLADPVHDGVLREDDGAFITLLPHLRRPKAFPHQNGTQIVDQFSVELVAVCGWNSDEGRESLAKGRSQGLYPSGGSNSAGAGSGRMLDPVCRSAASDTRWARATDSLHFRCLTSSWLASVGGAVAFAANNAISSSGVIGGADIAQPFEPIARLKV